MANGTDPFRPMPVLLRQLADIGFSGVQNFPTVGLIDGTFRANLEAAGMGYDKEVAAIRAAHEFGLFTSPYVFDAEQAAAMARAGADMLVAHAGLTTAGSIGAAVALSLDQAVQQVLTMAEAGRTARSDILVICHGAPFDEPDAVGKGLTARLAAQARATQETTVILLRCHRWPRREPAPQPGRGPPAPGSRTSRGRARTNHPKPCAKAIRTDV